MCIRDSAKAARKAGCAVLDRVVTADLLTNGGTVCGAAGFDIRTGDFHIIRAGAVIISTGGTNRLYSNPSGMSFNTWMCPADTGDGEAMSLRAGAELANIEFLRMTVVPRSFNAVSYTHLSRLACCRGEKLRGLLAPSDSPRQGNDSPAPPDGGSRFAQGIPSN